VTKTNFIFIIQLHSPRLIPHIYPIYLARSL